MKENNINIGQDGLTKINNPQNVPNMPYEAVKIIPSGTKINTIPDGLYVLNNGNNKKR